MGFAFTFERLHVGKTRLPGLIFSFSVTNPHPRLSQIWSYQFELWRANDINASETEYLGQLSANLATNAEWLTEYHQSQQRPCELVWHFEPRQIQRIEDCRRGQDVFFEIRGILLVASVYQGPTAQYQKASSQQEVAWDLPYMNNVYPLRLRIPQSDWIRFLSEMNFIHILSYEFPSPGLPLSFARAGQHVKKAWEHHKKGESDSALGSCFKAFECLGYDLLGTQSAGRRALVEYLLPDAPQIKRDAFIACLESLQNFMHLGRHARGAPSTISYEDSEMLLLCATALLGYLVKQHAHVAAP